MTMPVAGNATVVNFLMRFPALVPVAVAIGVAVAIMPSEPPAVKKAPVVIQETIPDPIVLKITPSIEALCPLYKSTKKLSAKEKKSLTDKGCRVKG